jgi:tryptophanyl-tRNA synthetase
MLGNYLGAMKNWVALQEKYDCLYCLVDLHAITLRQDPAELRERTYAGLALYLACGLDPARNILFAQSHVPAHAELGWILACHSYMGELSRMTQFKDKSAKQKNIPTGLFTYPTLMAADILLYQANLVPVGQDQKQHLELTRDLAIRMNNLYGELFKVPEIYVPPVGAKIMSLTEPTAKMSKSDPDPNATIFMDDTDDTITKKLKRAVTDSGTTIEYSEEKPGIRNLITIQAAITGRKPDDIVAAYAGKQYGHLKVETAEIVVECLRPIRERQEKLMAERAHLDKILEAGAEAAAKRAEKTLARVCDAVGFIKKR